MKSNIAKIIPVMIVLLLVSSSAFAAGPSAEVLGSDNTYLGYVGLGAGLAMGLGALGCGMGQGRAAAAALEGIARNPQAKGDIMTPMIIGLALIESISLYALVIGYLLSSAITG